MQLTMTGEYAVRAMMHLASHQAATTVPIGEISRAWEVPESFLRKIVARLVRAGLIISHRGSGGGISLSRSASTITVLDVVEAVEGQWALNRCLMTPAECSRTSWCPVHVVWNEAQRAFFSILSRRSLADLSADVSRATGF